MRISLNVDELSAIRNALATRRDDLRDLVLQFADDDRFAEPRRDAQEELEVVEALDAKLVKAAA